ncbi:transcriptional regulator [Streptomyces viridochromogenes DSM 40736]|uniref:Transcriptional regulator n=1 Tax=Streptomyces viridochromogenes (strain DSM 40736 / JCM 4977 / BCRC 1201 / Tue 494) TaxID=591159 RepID=D9WXQ6_STRVT|nr:GntR family transcriptional regulator [Streptomyces viridochromogenes]EFL33101.1 transcriptional regulator [Streptomyces viridochromogenes DSM 40736]
MSSSARADGAGRRFLQVAELLRDRIKDGTYPADSLLPPQRELAAGLGVSRDTIQRVLRQLSDEGLLDIRQGSGSRVRGGPPGAPPETAAHVEAGRPALGAWIDRAFQEEAEVSLDVFSLTSETLVGHLTRQAERIIVEQKTPPRALRVRMLLPAEDEPLAYPRAQDPDDPRIHERWRMMARRYVRETRELVARLGDAGVDTDLQVRRVRLTPTFKLYVLNGKHMLYGMYKPERTVITLDDEEETQVEAVDVLGAFSKLHSFHASGDERDAAFFEEKRDWFQSTWDVLGSTARREK